MQDVAGRQPLGGEGVYPLPGDTMALTAPSECLTPISETYLLHTVPVCLGTPER
jgi:hypothetical protein